MKNVTRNTEVVSHLRIANNSWTRLVGLLADDHLPEGHGLLITPCKDIHSFFMRFYFDAVFLDKDFQVVHIIENMAPWRVSPLVWKAKHVLELPAGTVAKTGTQVGDRLEVV